MSRCRHCGARLSRDWELCWLCHAPVEPGQLDEVPEDWDYLDYPGHVLTGPLARASTVVESEVTAPRGRGSRVRLYVRVGIVALAVLSTAAFLPHLAYTLTYGVFIGLLCAFVLTRMWGRGRRGRPV
jgi:hypothetical protein